MKRLIGLIVLVLLSFRVAGQTPQGIPWYDDKFSMFIHFGVYSERGGVYEGEPVRRGYSEQIQSWGGIQKDVYEKFAYEFNPEKFDADAIVALAREAGMRSIVITSKHHDGFCLFRTATTDFNMYDASPAHRDLIAELAEACRRGGIAFGLYYSLIDWHEPCADHITTHNATFITPDHHKLNMAQVKELVTGYGPISELWFDMGSLTPQQSRDMYDLVRRYQPECMISGRLGNGCYDFAVMGDNYYPSESLNTPWQSPASMFDETWGYRSWQERGSSHEKAQEKLRSLLRVVSGGGNFLLNIGPMGSGEVVPFEREVLLEIGRWLADNGDAVYGTSQSPFPKRDSWGVVTRKGNVLNIILSGEKPVGDVICLPIKGHHLLSSSGPAQVTLKGGVLKVMLDESAYDGVIKIIRLTFDSEVLPESELRLNEKMARNSYFCQDYYTNGVSVVNYRWNIKPRRNLSSLSFAYTVSEIGREMSIDVDGNNYRTVLSGQSPCEMKVAPVSVANREICMLGMGDFSGSLDYYEPVEWTPVSCESDSLSCRPMKTIFVRETVTSPVEQDVLFEIGTGNGMELYVNGESVVKHLNPYRCQSYSETVRVHLRAGENNLMLRSYNRYEKNIRWMLRVASSQILYRTDVPISPVRGGTVHSVVISDPSVSSPHQDCRFGNVSLNID